MAVYEGKWISGLNAGGRPKFKRTHWTNPQYRVIVEVSTGESELQKEPLYSQCTKHYRNMYHTIGFDPT